MRLLSFFFKNFIYFIDGDSGLFSDVKYFIDSMRLKWLAVHEKLRLAQVFESFIK